MLALGATMFVAFGAAAQTTTAPLDELPIYLDMYPAGVISVVRFDQQPDPEQTAREEMYIEQTLARRAEQTPLVADRALQADIKYYGRNEVLSAYLREQVAGEQIADSEISAYYEKNRDAMTVPEQVSFRHLFLLVPAGDDEAGKKKLELAERLHGQIKRGADFERLIGEYSEVAAAKDNKGQVGPVNTIRLNPAFQQALAGLKAGDITPPFRTPYGYEIVEITDRKSTSTKTLDEVRDSIRTALVASRAADMQTTLMESLRSRYPVEVNDKLLSATGELDPEAVVYTVAGESRKVGDLLADLKATYAFDEIADDRERLRAALPRMSVTDMVWAEAAKTGLLERPEMKARLRIVHDRLLGEQYFKRYFTSRVPTEEELRKFHAEAGDLFSTVPEAKGVVYQWDLPEQLQSLAGSERIFHEQSLKEEITRVLAEVKAGRISRDELASMTSQTRELDWFPEGPSGYRHDMAFFGASPGTFTEIYPTKTGLAVGWLEEKRPRKIIPLEESRDRVHKLLLVQWTDQEKKDMLDEIRREFALKP